MNHMLPSDSQTKPRIHRAGPRQWQVLIPTGKDILGNWHFRIASEHATKAQARKALSA